MRKRKNVARAPQSSRKCNNIAFTLAFVEIGLFGAPKSCTQSCRQRLPTFAPSRPWPRSPSPPSPGPSTVLRWSASGFQSASGRPSSSLNYFPNTHARTLVSGRSRLFGIIVENITNPFFPELIRSFEEIAVAHGYEILVSSSNSDPAVLTTCVRRMLERKVDGVAVMTFGEEEPVLDQLVNRNVPIVLAEFKLDDPKSSTILLDYSTGIHAAVQSPGGPGPQEDRLPGRPA